MHSSILKCIVYFRGMCQMRKYSEVHRPSLTTRGFPSIFHVNCSWSNRSILYIRFNKRLDY